MNNKTIRNMFLSLLIPAAACILQWIFWSEFKPFTWLLFYPAVFFSAQVGGLWGGMTATLLSAALAVFFFMEPTFTFNTSNPNTLYSAAVFILMGFLFSNLHERLIREQQKSMAFAIRKEVEQSLRMEAERLSLALESAQAGIWEWDLRTNKNTWSDELWKVYGLEPHSCEPSYEAWRNTIHPDDRLQAEQTVQTAAQNVTELRAEWRMVDRDGSIRWLMSHGKPIMNGQGQAERFLGVVIDITERKLADENLRESEARYRSFIDLTDQLGWVTNPNGEVEEDIPSFRKYTGQTYQETRGSGWTKAIHPDDLARTVQAWSNAVATKSRYEIEYRIRRHDGVYRDFIACGVPVMENDNSVHEWVGTCIDITERKRTEEKLRESEFRLRAFFRSCPLPITISQVKDGVYTDTNAAYEKLIGFQADEIIGHSAAELNVWVDIQRRAQMLKELQTKGSVQNFEFQLKSRDGKLHDMQIWAEWIELNGEPHAFAIAEDITERKQAEEALERTRNMLAEAQKIAHLGSFEYIAATQTTLWSKEEYCIYGLDPAGPSPSYEVMLQQCIHPDDAALLHETFTKAMQTRSAYELEHRVVRPDGSMRWVYDHGHPYFDGQGELVRYLGITLDITERKLMESQRVAALEKLRESEARYRLIAENSADVIWVLDPIAGKFTYVSPSVEKLRGYTAEEVMAQPVNEALTPDSLKMVSESLAVNLPPFIAKGSGTESFINEVDQPCKNGSIVHTEVITTYLFNEDGKVEIVGVSRDITERKRAEEKLRASEAKFKAVFDNAPIGISLLDPDRRLQESNDMLERIVHISKEGLAAGAYRNRKYIREDGTEIPVSELASTRAIVENRPIRNVVNGIIMEDGQIIWTQVSAAPLGLADKQIVVITQDITEWKRAEQALQKSEHRYRELVQNANSAIIRWKSDGTIAFFNEYAQSFFGYSAEEIIGKHVGIIVPQTESTGSDLSGLVKEIVTHPEQFINNVNENICKDGRRVWMVWSNKPVYNESGQLEEILAVGSDITERKRMENELRRSNAELEQFAYVASHDLQEPLRAVAGMVQLLGQRYKGQLDERADEYIGHAAEASARMQNLINDLLDYSRLERFGRPFEPADVERSLKIALANLQISIQESKAQITHDPLPILSVDERQITQVFQNLIGNAIKFRGEGTPHIHIGAEKVENAWCFSVRDNGIGIEPQYFERIFLVFQRLHTRREYPGTGIGLSLCKRIVERHGGRMWLESQPERGSTFFFTIPEKKS